MWNRKKNETLVVLLLRSQMSIFRESNGKIVNYPFDPKVVLDLEVKDETSFTNGLNVFFQQLKISNANAVLLLDSTTYFTQKMTAGDKPVQTNETSENQKSGLQKTKDLKAEPDSELENQKRLFVQNVPFANVFSTILSIDKEKILIALNRDFYEPVIKALTDRGVTVTAIFPMLVVSHLFKSNGFTAQTAGLLLNMTDKYHAHNFLKVTDKKEESASSVTALPQDDSDKKRLMILGVVFLVLIGTLVGVIIWSRQRDAISTPNSQLEEVLPVAMPKTTPLPVTQTPTTVSLTKLLAASTSASLSMRQLSIHIFNASNDAGASTVLIQQLGDTGFTTVSESSAETTLAGSIQVAVLPAVPLTLREALNTQMTDWGYQTTFREVTTQDYDIEITLTAL